MLRVWATASQRAPLARETLFPRSAGSVTSSENTSTVDERAREDARELRDELLARMRPEQIAALEVGQQVRRRPPRRR